jgi:hypothetical protein
MIARIVIDGPWHGVENSNESQASLSRVSWSCECRLGFVIPLLWAFADGMCQDFEEGRKVSAG